MAEIENDSEQIGQPEPVKVKLRTTKKDLEAIKSSIREEKKQPEKQEKKETPKTEQKTDKKTDQKNIKDFSKEKNDQKKITKEQQKEVSKEEQVPPYQEEFEKVVMETKKTKIVRGGFRGKIGVPGIGNIVSFLRKKSQKTIYPYVEIKDPRNLIILPQFIDLTKVNFSYPLLEPFVSAHLKWDKREKKIVYFIEEPELSLKEREFLAKIEKNLVEIIDVDYSLLKEREKLMIYLQKKVATLLEETGEIMNIEQYVKMMYYIIRDFVGMNEIEPLLHDPYIEDIGCDGLNVPIFIIHRRFGSIETSTIFKNSDYLSNFVIKLAERCGRYISYAQPLLDGSLPDGSRVQASFAKDVTTRGPTFSIRKFRDNPFSPIDMLRLGTVSIDMLAYLWFLIENDVSILICGGVSTGKTTMLNVLSSFIPPEDKIITIEDTRELNLPHTNWIPAVSRTGFGIPEASGKKYGEIDLFDLLKESFRQNPDYVIVGEVRGKEANVMFQGMASGHPSIGTIHAGSIDDVIKRLETPPISLPPSLIDSLDLLIVMVNAREKGKSSRRIKEIVEIQSLDRKTGKAHTLKTFGWVPSVDNFRENIDISEVLHRISFEKGINYPNIKQEIITRKNFFKWLDRHNITDFKEVSQLINLYYKDKNTILKWIENDMNPYQNLSREKVEKMWETATGLKILR